MNCPKCSARLKWDEGAYCTRCMFEASTHKPPVAPPPASPEPMPEGWAKPEMGGWRPVGPTASGEPLFRRDRCCVITVAQLRSLLATQGLRIVDDASAKVLEAIRDAEIEIVGGVNRQRKRFMFELQEHAVCESELARREKEKP